jgi:hypothetical protein
MQPINPVFPAFTALCCKCGQRTESPSAAAGDEPFTFVCFVCQDNATREAVWRHTNEQVRRFSREQPAWVAACRRARGIVMPRRAQCEDPNDPAWAGCERE